jgi:hypothetical protein
VSLPLHLPSCHHLGCWASLAFHAQGRLAHTQV